jgi:Tol biopolymer transport system component
MSNWLKGTIRVLIALLALTESACDDKGTEPHVYAPYPQQLYDVSADSHCVYFRDDGRAFGRPAGIYRIRLDGDTAVEPVIIDPSVYFPRVSPSGRQLAFVDLANALVIRDLESGKDSVILRADVVDIDWYNEDTLVCETYTSRIIVVDIAAGSASEIWRENGWRPAVAHQGTVVFLQYYAQSVDVDSSTLFLSSIGGDTLGTVAAFRRDFCYAPDLSESGDRTILVRNYLYQPRLALVTIPEGTLTDSLALFAADPFFTQNDRILYILLGDKSRSEKDQIWIMDSDGSHEELLMH